MREAELVIDMMALNCSYSKQAARVKLGIYFYQLVGKCPCSKVWLQVLE